MTESDVQTPGPPDRIDETGLIVDLRPPAAFAGGHLPGSISVSDPGPDQVGAAIRDLVRRMGGGELPPLYLLAPDLERARRVAPLLERETGLDRAGILPVSALSDWAAGGGRMRTVGRITPAELQDRAAVARVILLQVGSRLSEIPSRSAALDSEPTMVVAAGDDGTTMTAASLVLALGRDGPVLALETRPDGV